MGWPRPEPHPCEFCGAPIQRRSGVHRRRFHNRACFIAAKRAWGVIRRKR